MLDARNGMERFSSNCLKEIIAAEERILEQKDISLRNWGGMC